MVLRLNMLLSGFAALILTVPLMADEIYTYTGPDYTTCTGSYQTAGCGTHNVKVVMDLTSTLGDNLSGGSNGDLTTLSPDPVVSWSFTDGAATISSALGNLLAAPDLELDVTTNGSGTITNWVLIASSSTASIESFGNLTSTFDVTYPVVDGVGEAPALGQYSGSPSGPWSASSSTSTVPEPENLALIGIGLAAIGVARQRLQRRKA